MQKNTDSRLNKKCSAFIFSILVVSRSCQNLSQLLSTIVGSININLNSIEVLCSWNGTKEDEDKVAVPPGLNFRIVDRSSYHFAYNMNTLADLAKGEYVCVANDDVKLKPSALFNSLKYLVRPNIGLVGAILLFPNGKIQHCGISFREDMSPYHIDKGVDFIESDCIHSPRVVEGCTGALFFCRSSLYRAIKMRENFTECGEDICFSIDLTAKTGLSIVVPNDVIAEHKEGDTRAKIGRQGTPPSDLEFIKKHAAQFKRKKISVSIKTEEKGWIFYRMAEEVQRNVLNCDVEINGAGNDADIVYFIHYARYDEKIAKGRVTIANFTHYVKGTNAEPLFNKIAHKVDHCVAISESTRRDLLARGVSDDGITVIEIGAAKEFTPKVVMGVVGRIYNDGRKGEDLVKKLAADQEVMKYVELVAMDDCWGLKTINVETYHLFYSLIDYLLVPSRVEGGPVPFMEALACGKLSIAPSIGVIPSFPHIDFEAGNYESMRSKVIETAKNKISELQDISSSIVNKNWEKWAFEHHLIFENAFQSKSQKEFVEGLKMDNVVESAETSLPLAYANKLFCDGLFDQAQEAYRELVESGEIPETILQANIRLSKKRATQKLCKSR